MKKVLLVLILTVSLLGAAWAGHHKGYGDAHLAWETRIEESKQELRMGTYYTSLTNTRACVLALDSAVVRFISDPTPEVLREIMVRQEACDVYWGLVIGYLPAGDGDGIRILRQAKFEFGQWVLQINHLTKSRVFLIMAINAGRVEQAKFLTNSIQEELEELRFYRNRMEDLLVEAWNAYN